MNTVLFLHSAGPQGAGEGSRPFAASLAAALGPGYALARPRMPEPDAPDYGRWRGALRRVFARLRDVGPLILVGHSLGGSVLLKYLSEEEERPEVAALALVAVPWWGAPGWEVDDFRLRKGFAARLPPIPFIGLYHSRDDEVVEYRHLSRYARAMPGAVVRPQRGLGHACRDGVPELVADLRALPASRPRGRRKP